MHNLEEWRWDEGMEAMPSLEKVKIRGCPKLRFLPEGLYHHAPRVFTKLEIQAANSLEEIKSFGSLKEFVIGTTPKLKTISGSPVLQVIKLEYPALKSLPQWLSSEVRVLFPQLRRLEITADSAVLLRRCLVGAQDWPKIQHIPSVYARSKKGAEYISYTKDPFTFNTNLKNGDDK